jgi:hypothetical protein
MKASDTTTLLRSRAAITPSISPADMASGFSTSTCLPASAALIAHSTCCEVGSGM